MYRIGHASQTYSLSSHKICGSTSSIWCWKPRCTWASVSCAECSRQWAWYEICHSALYLSGQFVEHDYVLNGSARRSAAPRYHQRACRWLPTWRASQCLRTCQSTKCRDQSFCLTSIFIVSWIRWMYVSSIHFCIHMDIGNSQRLEKQNCSSCQHVLHDRLTSFSEWPTDSPARPNVLAGTV